MSQMSANPQYRIDLNFPAKLVPCSIVPSVVVGKVVCVNEDGSSVVVEPDGSQVRVVPAGQPNWDSAYTQATLYGDFLVYRSANGTPRGYKIIS